MSAARFKVGTVFEGDQVRGVVRRGKRIVAETQLDPRSRPTASIEALDEAERMLRRILGELAARS
jgi:phosphopantothenate synthetase